MLKLELQEVSISRRIERIAFATAASYRLFGRCAIGGGNVSINIDFRAISHYAMRAPAW